MSPGKAGGAAVLEHWSMWEYGADATMAGQATVAPYRGRYRFVGSGRGKPLEVRLYGTFASAVRGARRWWRS